jgi:hypothetical protein
MMENGCDDDYNCERVGKAPFPFLLKWWCNMLVDARRGPKDVVRRQEEELEVISRLCSKNGGGKFEGGRGRDQNKRKWD